MPLRPVLAVIAVVASLGAAHGYREHRAAVARQAAILEARDAMADEVAGPMRDLRPIETWAVQLGTAELLPVREPALHHWLATPAVYLRVPLAEATSVATVRAAARANVVDGLASCLSSSGAVHAYGDLVARQELIGDAFTQAVHTSWNRLSLDAVDRTLAGHRAGHHATLVKALSEVKVAVVAVDEPGGGVRVAVRRLSDGSVLLRQRVFPSYGLVTIAGGPPSALAEKQAAACSVGLDLVAAR